MVSTCYETISYCSIEFKTLNITTNYITVKDKLKQNIVLAIKYIIILQEQNILLEQNIVLAVTCNKIKLWDILTWNVLIHWSDMIV